MTDEATLAREHADMAARLRAIAQIVNGGDIPTGLTSSPTAPATPGCNCVMNGHPDPNVHAFGCPYSPPLRAIRTVKAFPG